PRRCCPYPFSYFATAPPVICTLSLHDALPIYLRQRKLGLALKRLHAVYHIFDVWQEDQFDFHGFSLRKGMIRAYVDMIRWEDRLDRKSTRLNSSHVSISYAVFCLKKKK